MTQPGSLTGTKHAWLKVSGELQPQQLPVSSTLKTYLEAAVSLFSLCLLLEQVHKRCREMNPSVTTHWDSAGTSPSSQAPCVGWGSGQGKLRMLQTWFIHWMRVISTVCFQTRVWDGIKITDSTALFCGNQWLLGHWPWQATLHSTGVQERAVEVKSCFEPEQPFQIPVPGTKCPFPRSKADNPLQGSYW